MSNCSKTNSTGGGSARKAIRRDRHTICVRDKHGATCSRPPKALHSRYHAPGEMWADKKATAALNAVLSDLVATPTLTHANTAVSTTPSCSLQATVNMAGDGQAVGYLHATAPTKRNSANGALRLREDTACGATFTFDTPVEVQSNITVELSTGLGRTVDVIQFSFCQLPYAATLLAEQSNAITLKSECCSHNRLLRIWKNTDETEFEVSAVRAPGHWDKGRTTYQQPLLYRFDLHVDNE
eukprot:COSAG02_NODE_1028_length_15086_cov_21.563555_1_plen_239_part_10